jgi:energy-converting hydrogenase Eha subunit E
MAKKKLSFIPQILDLSLYAGDGAGLRFTITDSTGAALPLTGTMKAQIRANRENADPALAEFDVDLTDFAIGVVLVSLTGEQTHALISAAETFVGVWDLEWTPENDEPATLVQGSVECLPDVTH